MTNYDMDELRRRGKIPDEVEKRREFARDIIESEKNKNCIFSSTHNRCGWKKILRPRKGLG